MILEKYLLYLENEYIPKNERLEVKNFRDNNKFIWLYHGTNLRLKNEIKIYGLKTEKMGDYIKEFLPEQKNFIWTTSIKKYAMNYAKKSKDGFFDFKKYLPLLVKVETKFLIFDYHTKFFPFSYSFDEYRYPKNIPINNILFPDDEKYNKIENINNYLDNKI